ncbi:hypothetical protein RSAG8_00125, partial [Rhizoctonia solani AG-8 WAC10335]
MRSFSLAATSRARYPHTHLRRTHPCTSIDTRSDTPQTQLPTRDQPS